MQHDSAASARDHATARFREAGALLTLTALLQRYLPRGKGSVPRWLGKTFALRRPRYLTTRHGARLAMSRGSYDVYATMKLEHNAWDPKDFAVCLNNLPGDGLVFYDVGANVGYFSVEMAATQRGVRVVAFEPQSDLVEAIVASVALNRLDNLQVVEALVGDESRDAELYLAPSSIHASAVIDSGRTHVRTVPKQMIAIDERVAAGAIPAPDFVKIDVEGSEHLVLRGAARTLRQHRPNVFMEYFAEFDAGGRVRREVEALRADAADYELFGQPNNSMASRYPYPFFRVRSDADWRNVHAMLLRNKTRPVRDATVFEP